MKSDDGVKELRNGERTRELGESVRDMDSWRGRVRDKVGETHEADRAALVCLKV